MNKIRFNVGARVMVGNTSAGEVVGHSILYRVSGRDCDPLFVYLVELDHSRTIIACTDASLDGLDS